METYPQIVCITGASAGFGAAIARKFAAAGAKLALFARRRERLDELARELAVPVHCGALDVRDRRAVIAAFASLPAEFAAVDLLVNNAGLALGLDPAPSADLDDWDAMIDTNDKGLVYCTRAVLPGMVTRGRGHIVNMGSTAGSYPYPGGNVYCASKAFVKQFSLSLRADLAGTGVRVTNLEPGMSRTDFSLVRFKGHQERADAEYEGVAPLTGEDIAEAVYWAATRPPHVNVNRIELMPLAQAPGPLAIQRIR